MKYGDQVYVGELFPGLFNVCDRKQGASFDGNDVYGVRGTKLAVSKYGKVLCGPTNWDRTYLSVEKDLIPAYEEYLARLTFYYGNKTRGKNQPEKETPIQVAERKLAESQNKMRDIKFTIRQTIKDLKDQIEILEEIYNDI